MLWMGILQAKIAIPKCLAKQQDWEKKTHKKMNDFDAIGHRREVIISLTSEKRQRRGYSKKTPKC
jgi:hypothetical protein